VFPLHHSRVLFDIYNPHQQQVAGDSLISIQTLCQLSFSIHASNKLLATLSFITKTIRCYAQSPGGRSRTGKPYRRLCFVPLRFSTPHISPCRDKYKIGFVVWALPSPCRMVCDLGSAVKSLHLQRNYLRSLARRWANSH
jgi:hypothetical protein